LVAHDASSGTATARTRHSDSEAVTTCLREAAAEPVGRAITSLGFIRKR
jgi:hypothetical protein